MTRITTPATRLVEIPFATPITTAIHRMHSIGCVLVDPETDQGIVSQGYLSTLIGTRLKAFDEMVRGHVIENCLNLLQRQASSPSGTNIRDPAFHGSDVAPLVTRRVARADQRPYLVEA